MCELGDSSVADQVGAGAVNNRGPARSPDPKNWKNTLSLSDVAQGHGHGPEGSGRLPVILEDKYYPRRTMKYVLLGIPFYILFTMQGRSGGLLD